MEKITGLYFESQSNNQDKYLIAFEVRTDGHNVFATIYEIKEEELWDINNGTEISCFEATLEVFVTIDIWNKYYFPSFPQNQYQWYHDFDKNETCDQIKGMHDVMQFALAEGLKIGNIELY